jgi:hypothetical protein
MRLGKVTADEAAVTVSVKCRAANDRVGRQIEARSMILAAWEGSFNASFRSMFERSTVSTMIHDMEAEIDKLQFIQERHSAVQQIQMMESESLDFIPAEFIDVKLDKVSSSPTNPLNQGVRVELKLCAMFHGFIVDPVDQLLFLDDSSQTVIVRVANVCRCL